MDEIGALSEPDEVVRRHHGSVGILPADQCFESRQFACRQFDLWLVVEGELSFVDGTTKPSRERQPLSAVVVEVGGVEGNALVRLLGCVHRDVSPPQEVDRSQVWCVRGRHANTGFEVYIDPREGERTPKRHQESFDPSENLGLIDRLDVERELVTTETGDQIGLLEGRLETLSHFNEEIVAARVAQRIVHLLEPVQVDEQHRDSLYSAQRLFEALLEERPVRQSSQWIVSGQKNRVIELPAPVALQDEQQEDQRSQQEQTSD